MRRERPHFTLSLPMAALIAVVLVVMAACTSVEDPGTPSEPAATLPASSTGTVTPEETGKPTPAATAADTATPSPTATASATATAEATETVVPQASPEPTEMPPLEPVVGLESFATGMAAPLVLAPVPDDSGRFFVADQVGVVWVLTEEGERLETPYLDLRDRMVALNAGYDERGLLGLAPHPEYAENGRVYVYYSAPLRSEGTAGWNHTSHIAEFTVSSDNPDQADPESEQIILQVDQPQGNHNGGHIAFGPDGYLYIALGDGGNANDVGLGHTVDTGNGQDVTNLLGSILRIDVDTGDPYAIPEDNPFVDADGRDEIFAYGFRNPFRMSFDSDDGRLFTGDVGQNLWEEVNIVTLGGNYGWNIREGNQCFSPQSPNNPPNTCLATGHDGSDLLPPILEYQNSNVQDGLGRAVIGGYVYRGNNLVSFGGRYVFGDWSQSFSQPAGTLFVATPPEEDGQPWPFEELEVAGRDDGRLGEFLLAFGEDLEGELYVLTSERSGPSGDTGKVYRVTAPE